MKKVGIVTFKENAQAYEALSQLKQISKSNTLAIKQAALIKKSFDGTNFVVKDQLDYQSEERVFTGGLIGIIVGILGGPLGILCGWIVGDLAGVSTNYIQNKKLNTIFDRIATTIKNDEIALLIYMEEEDVELLNTMVVDKLHGHIERFDYAKVKEDIDEAKKHLH